VPRILVLADCDSELGDRPVMLDEEVGVRSLGDPHRAVRVFDRVVSAVTYAEEVERRISAAYTT
jgi:hypothetical protein